MQFQKAIFYFNPKMGHMLNLAMVEKLNRAGFVVAPYSTPEEQPSVKSVSGPAGHVGEAAVTGPSPGVTCAKPPQAIFLNWAKKLTRAYQKHHHHHSARSRPAQFCLESHPGIRWSGEHRTITAHGRKHDPNEPHGDPNF